MSRKYLNDKYCVRCSRNTPCPYLRDNYDKIAKLLGNRKFSVLDIGCGNGRNSEFILENGQEVVSLDMVNDYGQRCILGKETLPVYDHSIDLILCNYLMMFLDKAERNQLISEINRVANKGCIVVLELYPAKDCYAKTEPEVLAMQKDIFDKLGWDKIRYSKARFIARKNS